MSRTRIVTLTKWFPPNDPLAAKIARLCILREDFNLEMHGVFAEEIKPLDGLSDEWRRLYFIRRIIGTLDEIEAGIQRLLGDAKFKILLAAQKPEWIQEFENHKKAMVNGVKVLNEIRNDIVGHVREPVVEKTLNELAGTDIIGFLEIGPTLQESYYKFAGELVVQILVRGVPEADKHGAFMEKIKKIGDLVYAFALIEKALHMYMEDHNLLLRQQR